MRKVPSVSYTHLDVYKRQLLLPAEQIAIRLRSDEGLKPPFLRGPNERLPWRHLITEQLGRARVHHEFHFDSVPVELFLEHMIDGSLVRCLVG